MHDYVSNSQLGSLQELIYGKEKPDNIQEIYDFGNLFDSVVTEEEKFDSSTNIMTDQQREVLFEEYLVEKAMLMKEAVESDPMFKLIMESAKKQHVIYRKAQNIDWNGFSFKLPIRVKMDLYVQHASLVVDLKSTACTTRKQFVASIQHFNYDRQAAFYLDASKCNKFLFIGVSKTKNRKTGKHEVFKYMIERDSEDYFRGLEKYSELAFKYDLMINHFPKNLPFYI